MSNGGSGKFKTVDRRAASQSGPEPFVDPQGKVLQSFGQPVTQEQLLDNMGEHFRNNIRHASTSGKLRTVQDYANLFNELSTWAESQYAQEAKRYDFPKMDRRQLLQAMAERGEMSTIKAGLERLGLRKQVESLVRRVRDAKGMDRPEFQKFVNQFVEGKIELRALIESASLKEYELEGIKKAFIDNKEVYEMIKTGRDFGVVAGYSYKHATGALEASGAVRRAARQLGKSNLAELMGSATWAVDMLSGGQGTLEQHLIKSHTAKHSRITTYLNVQRLAAIILALGIGYFVLRAAGSCACGAIGATGAKEGAREKVQSRKRTPVEELLYSNPNTRQPLKSLSMHLRNSGIAEEGQKKIVLVLATLGQQTLNSAEIGQTIKLIAELLPLEKSKISNAKIGETATLLQLYVGEGREMEAAKYIVKTAKSAEGINAIFEKPIPGMKMSAEWQRRPFKAFTEAGFGKSELLGQLCSDIRTASRKKGKEIVPLGLTEQNSIAAALAKAYSSTKKKEVSSEYAEDLQFMVQLMGKGATADSAGKSISMLRALKEPKFQEASSFLLMVMDRGGTLESAQDALSMLNSRFQEASSFLLMVMDRGGTLASAQNALSMLNSRFKPAQFEVAAEALVGLMGRGFKPDSRQTEIALRLMGSKFKDRMATASAEAIPLLSPSMGEREMGAAMDSVAFEARELASGSWANATDPRLLFLGEKLAKQFSESLRLVASQEEYDGRVELLASFAQKWNSEVKPLTKDKFEEVLFQVSPVFSLPILQHLPPEDRAQVLFSLIKDFQPGTITRNVVKKGKKKQIEKNPREEVLSHITKKFAGAEAPPTAAEVVDAMGAYLESNPDYKRKKL